MKNIAIKTILVVMAAVIVGGLAFNVQAKRRTAASVKPVKELVPDITRKVSEKVLSYDECIKYKQAIEKQVLPYFKKSFDRNAKTAQQKTVAVLAKLDKYAEDELEAGSNFEMADAGYVHDIVYRYNTFASYCEQVDKAPSAQARDAIKSEVTAWLQLENDLRHYCENAAQVRCLGGSMAILEVAGSGWSIAEIRSKDFNSLLKAGFNSTPATVKMGETGQVATQLVIELNNEANDLSQLLTEDDLRDNAEFYKQLCSGVTAAATGMTVSLPKWIEARYKLLQYSKNSDAGVAATAALLAAIKKTAICNEE